MKVSHATAVINVRPVYECATCGTCAAGDSMELELRAYDPQELPDRIADMVPPPARMPVGWASFYGPRATIFRCESCTNLNQESRK